MRPALADGMLVLGLHSTEAEKVDPEITHTVMQWWQFLDHNLDHSMEAVSRETFSQSKD